MIAPTFDLIHFEYPDFEETRISSCFKNSKRDITGLKHSFLGMYTILHGFLLGWIPSL